MQHSIGRQFLGAGLLPIGLEAQRLQLSGSWDQATNRLPFTAREGQAWNHTALFRNAERAQGLRKLGGKGSGRWWPRSGPRGSLRFHPRIMFIKNRVSKNSDVLRDGTWLLFGVA